MIAAAITVHNVLLTIGTMIAMFAVPVLAFKALGLIADALDYQPTHYPDHQHRID